MVWAIIGVLILAVLIRFCLKGANDIATDTVEYVKEQTTVNKLNKDDDKIANDWHTRVKQLNINL